MQLYDATGNAAEADRSRKVLAARKAAQRKPNQSFLFGIMSRRDREAITYG